MHKLNSSDFARSDSTASANTQPATAQSAASTRSRSVALREVCYSRHNNLNLIRFIAALAVIFSHSFSVTQGANSPATFLDQLTADRLSFGGLAVGIFFLYSGFLIAKSCERHASFSEFFRKRVLRIFPELLVCVIACVIIAGFCLSSLGAVQFFTNLLTYKYLLNACLIPVHSLPGVFETNPYPAVVNAALWTLPVEFVCYVFCYALYRLTAFDPKRMLVFSLIPSAALAAYIVVGHNFMLSAMRAVLEFYIGVLLWSLKGSIKLNIYAASFAGLLFIGLCVTGYDLAAMLIAFPYLCLWFGWGTRHIYDSFSAKQDYSYGIFLWGFPVQQTLVWLFMNHAGAPMPFWLNTLLSWGIAAELTWLTAQFLRALNSVSNRLRSVDTTQSQHPSQPHRQDSQQPQRPPQSH